MASARTHVVRQGEDIASIAARYGVANPTRVWEDPANAALRERRSSMHVLAPGDEVAVPAPEPKIVERATGQRHRFEVRLPTVELKLRLRLPDGTALASANYTLEYRVGGVARTIDGVTRGDGAIEQVLPVSVRTAVLHLPEQRLRWPLRIGHLDPHLDRDSGEPRVAGAQARLNNLGFTAGRVDGELGPKTRHALAAFQSEVMGREDATGDLDEETCNRLAEEHGA